MPVVRNPGPVRKSVDKELSTLKALETVSGTTAQRLADLLDEMRSARDAAPVARELRLIMEQIRTGAVPEEQDPLDEIGKRRAERRAAAG